MSDHFEDLVLLLEPGKRPEPELVARLGAAEERRNSEIKRVLGEMEKGKYEIVDLEKDEY
ncbi:hypothetical protein [Rhizobium sp. MHM7A]|uniref:hypothetical protein n=1 Tax=Rhizobium sp. MHM7A TaxID=2583233 RepID=UPI001107341A|nr:hypothetical protein [Rhizobium sp. MHM7A]TLX17007.1 hypothetical protein FFR93_06720 [Rhizobium sp. MHM7A]